ncbi:hypothetical protein AJ79_05698 [Helicocarpus griseus UAMH5409]|uniref:Uncharacterized protein n=1 Tax=Helicocarpus griseus UAMH5409 TaxID=1447875 RepID=A0A2B7XJQ9_9EURO|nr:hypothetical protein AJ79_05698 [Helicocarpus griseus UAMH5409]
MENSASGEDAKRVDMSAREKNVVGTTAAGPICGAIATRTFANASSALVRNAPHQATGARPGRAAISRVSAKNITSWEQNTSIPVPQIRTVSIRTLKFRWSPNLFAAITSSRT